MDSPYFKNFIEDSKFARKKKMDFAEEQKTKIFNPRLTYDSSLKFDCEPDKGCPEMPMEEFDNKKYI